jgi:hypothetical protein
MAYSKARRLSDSISATGEVSAFVDGSITHADLHTDMDLTGKTVLVANASTGDSDTTAANTAFVQQEIAALVASAPGTLNTLNELAAALGDDASFSTTVTNSIATKLPLSGGAMTGAITTNSTFDGVDIAARDAVLTSTTTTANAALPKAGGTMTGTIAGFTSTGIDDNATSTAITIDSSENVGIAGQTSPTYKFDGGFADQTWGWYLSSAYNSGFTYNTTERSLLIHTKSGDNLDHIKFAVGTSATERLRIASAGQIGIGGANYGTDGQILTSTGATSAPAWEDAPASGPSKGLAIVLSMIF